MISSVVGALLHLLLLLRFGLCVSVCALVSSFLFTSVASPVVWSEAIVIPFLSCILFNHMCVSVCVLVSSFSLHLLLLLWFGLKLLSSHSCLLYFVELACGQHLF